MGIITLAIGDERPAIQRCAAADTHRFAVAARAAADFILSTTDGTRSDRLWPPDYLVFNTNPMSVAAGACGTAVVTNSIIGSLPLEVTDWLLAQRVDELTYAPGLFPGIAGIAWSFAMLGHVDEGIDLMRRIDRSPLQYEDYSVFQGVAGWGLACLWFYRLTTEARFLDRAIEGAQHLMNGARAVDGTLYWPNKSPEPAALGLALGASGIGLFLLQVGIAAQRDDLVAASEKALMTDISQGREDGDALIWGAMAGDPGIRPYWLRGASGIGAAAIRFHSLLERPFYLEVARRAAMGTMSFFAVSPGQFEGLSGIGEFMLDMYRATRDERFLINAIGIGDSVLNYVIPRGAGVAFPGRNLNRIATDFGYGTAGVAEFLWRLHTLGPRRFHDEPNGWVLGTK